MQCEACGSRACNQRGIISNEPLGLCFPCATEVNQMVQDMTYDKWASQQEGMSNRAKRQAWKSQF